MIPKKPDLQKCKFLSWAKIYLEDLSPSIWAF